uniref:KOW domain-containing protein n=1 Tax=Setaria italica TaxID=4555 RepID=K4AM61_SETIT
MEEKNKLSISIACKLRPAKPPSRPAAADDGPKPAPTAQFVTEFDPSPTLPPAAAPVVVPPLPNSVNFGPRKPSSLTTSQEEAALAAQSPACCGGPAFVLDNPCASTRVDPRQCVGKSHRDRKEDTKAADRHRAGKHGFGYNPSELDPRKSRSGEWTFAANNKMTGNGTARKRGRDASDTTEEKDHNAGRRHNKISGEKRSRTTTKACEEERDGGQGNTALWLQSHIRVRVVSEKLGKRLYLMKGKVVDVVAPTACDVVMDDDLELVQGVEQGMLETVLPRTNGRVLVLYGKHKGVRGRLVEKDSEEEVGLVEDADSKAVVRVRFDQMAEYTVPLTCSCLATE